MEWINSSSSSSVQEKQPQQKGNEGEMMAVEGLYEKVMTNDQMEVLRKQIAVYAMICEQLVDMHSGVVVAVLVFKKTDYDSSSSSSKMKEMMVVEGLYVKVMTDEQMELLRKQIAVYAMISEQLVQMHKSLSAQYDIAAHNNSPNPNLSRRRCRHRHHPSTTLYPSKHHPHHSFSSFSIPLFSLSNRAIPSLLWNLSLGFHNHRLFSFNRRHESQKP
ncbi:hypothetical protein Ddye_014488 [Dipteronia dyeriana]|uniref:Uncharacterized protein n=1 Tax=Dipteronia dyeriana TaxID=168575 RepID=A0AAD9X8D5_9ROSI|nr:hypothetical protein Ddye_014488 [Dipteronia dyeriana]